MNEEQIRILTECEQRSKSNTHRLDKLEASTEALNKLAVSVEVMGTNLQNMDKTLQKLDKKVEEQEAKPGKRWEDLVKTVIGIVVGALLALAFTHMGIA
jgi:tetrahydromethanopterin S-methyltransferase subunit G